MLVVLVGINFFINEPIGVIALGILLLLIVGIVIMLYYRFQHLRKKISFSSYSIGDEDKLSHSTWEVQMANLAKSHKQVHLVRYNFVLDDYNQIAYKKLNKLRNRFSDVSTDIISLIPAARWLFDNFQIMYREIKKVRTSGTSYAILPTLKSKEHRGFPRVYIVAKKMVDLSQGHLNEENIAVMLKAYQKEVPLTDKELWALPEMLGFCLLESIIEISEEILQLIQIKYKADRFVKSKMNEKKAFHISDINHELTQEMKYNYSFHSHVIYLLKNMSFDDNSIQKYIDYHFHGLNKWLGPSTIFTEEGKIESFLESKIRALIVSLRDMNEIDTEQFFEEYSYLEKILSKDPVRIYPKMDNESKGMYRGVIVKLSLKHKISEEMIANACLELAKEGRADLHCSNHVGAYLLGKGYPILKAKVLNKKVPDKIKLQKNVKGVLYFCSFFFIFLCLCTLIGMIVKGSIGNVTIAQIVIALMIMFPLFMGIAQEITNFIFTRHISVKKIPSLDYLNGIPDEARTFVVMPVIVSSKEQGLEYLDRLQKHYLANQQTNLYYGLLMDYADSTEQSLPSDQEILDVLVERVDQLNAIYPSEHQRFSLFIRYRKWNKEENCYMCWERKRGKLEEFNSLLSGAKKEETSFSLLYCEQEMLSSFRYVLTLDADTNLIRDNASKLVGLIDHPLNRPVIDRDEKKVKEGYVIVQPSVRNHIVDKSGSHFTEIFGGDSGLAHYGAVISDIYQDVFHEAIYCGKGIYDIEAFHSLLHNLIPENSVLSHDLLESCYAKAAFASNAKVMDTFPGSVLSYGKREHRWIRGDWQLLPWLFSLKKIRNHPLSALCKWKIFDNLRRSLVPMSKLLFIIWNLVYLPGVFCLWIPFVFFSEVFNLLVLIINTIKQKILRPKLALVYKSFFKGIGVLFERALIEFTILPYRAYYSMDAMMRTLFRLCISKKNLLRWNTAEAVDSSIIHTPKGYFLTMWSSVVSAFVLLVLLLINKYQSWIVFLYAVVAFVWIIAFYIAYSISQSKEKCKIALYPEDIEILRETARRTWQFFKTFSSKENNWLCPDNVQLSHTPKISNKTSPTNIGMQFLSILSARDMGFETLTATVTSIENLLDTIMKLPKWNGHLYNWYHIETLEILKPDYISTVDSGNYLGHLIAVKNGLLDQVETPIISDDYIRELVNVMDRSNHEQAKRMLEETIPRYERKKQYQRLEEFIEDVTDIWEDLKEKDIENRKDMPWSVELLNQIENIVNEVAKLNLKKADFSSGLTLKMLEEEGNKNASNMINRIKNISSKIDHMVANADFRPLYNDKRMLFHIGYHVESQTLDAGCYDLMASESALTSFLAVAKGEVSTKHWYKLGRPLTIVKGIPCFVSWSGTMFEYLMPNLVLREYEGSVFAETSKAAVLQQMNYANGAKIPWGISESQYYRFDLNSNYQYKAFGVPKLRLQPVRKDSMVVTPYAAMLALEYEDRECLSNLKEFNRLGVFAEYGYYEAIDFNVPNAIEMTPYCIVKSFMAHHQGMIMVAIDNYINNSTMRKRFHKEPMIKATEVLLEEKRQTNLISLARRGYTIKIGKELFYEDGYNKRYVNGVAPKLPATLYLSNNIYSLMVTSDGDGFSKHKDMMLYRWRADIHANTGNYIYIKDLKQAKLWSVAYHPTRTEPDEYQVIFSPHKAEFKRKDGDISTHTTVTLDADYNFEIRKVTLTNHGKEERQFELTSYLEVVADSHLAELSHPAFNKLFIESEYLEKEEIFLSRRRSRQGNDTPYIFHMIRTGDKLQRKIEYENDRLKFIGRNHTVMNPSTVVNSISFSNHAGFSNDPIMSMRAAVSLRPGESANISFITGVCQRKEEAIKIGEELTMAYRVDDVFEKFRLQTDIELKYLEITGAQVNAFQDMASPIYYPVKEFRGPKENIRRNYHNQTSLWRFGVSGDHPILLLLVNSMEDEGIIKDVLKAYEYLRINRVLVDLVILIDAKHGYLQEVDVLINDMTSSLKIYDAGSDRPSFFTLHTYQMIPAEIDLLYTVARIVFSDKTGIHFREIKEKLGRLIEE